MVSLHNLVNRGSVNDIHFEHLRDEICCLLFHPVRECEYAVWITVSPMLKFHVLTFDLVKQSRNVLIIERQGSCEHGVEYDSTRPEINFRTNVETVRDKFRGCVVRRAAARRKEVTIGHVV